MARASARYYCVINEEHNRKGNRGAGREGSERYECGVWPVNEDYAAQPVRGEPRGSKPAGIRGARSCSLAARAEGEKRLRSATRKP